MTPQPRPALRRANDADVHPALAVVAAREATPMRLGAQPEEPPDDRKKDKKSPKGKAGGSGSAKATEAMGKPFQGAGRSTSDTLRAPSRKRVDLNVRVPKNIRKEVRAVAKASGTTPDDLVTEVLVAWLGDARRQ
jgi:hypothetical protein